MEVHDLDPVQLIEPEPETHTNMLRRALQVGKDVVSALVEIVKEADPVEGYRKGPGF